MSTSCASHTSSLNMQWHVVELERRRIARHSDVYDGELREHFTQNP
ncbi:MAG: hypothetical protein V7K40_31050 [Nostoc sp.]